jgi:hypothetical protein
MKMSDVGIENKLSWHHGGFRVYGENRIRWDNGADLEIRENTMDRILRTTPVAGKLAVYGRTLPEESK